MLLVRNTKYLPQITKDAERFGYNDIFKCIIDSKVFGRIFCTRISFEGKMKGKIAKAVFRPEKTLSIEVETKNIGGGFIAYHGTGTYVYCHQIGDNFVVHQNVTIGRGKTINGISIPIIGNNVFVGADTVILPSVTIGNNVIIGAHSTVTHDITDNSVVVGSPAKIICSLDEYLGKEKKRMKNSKCYGEEYTLRKNVSMEMRMKQNEELKGKIGYID